MPLIGFIFLTVVALYLYYRSERTDTRVTVWVMWAVVAAWSFGLRA